MRSTVTRDEATNAICTMLDGGSFIIAADVITADHIEDQLDAAALSGLLAQSDEIFGVVIDGGSAPSLRQASHFSGVPAVTMTRAPNALPS